MDKRKNKIKIGGSNTEIIKLKNIVNTDKMIINNTIKNAKIKIKSNKSNRTLKISPSIVLPKYGKVKTSFKFRNISNGETKIKTKIKIPYGKIYITENGKISKTFIPKVITIFSNKFSNKHSIKDYEDVISKNYVHITKIIKPLLDMFIENPKKFKVFLLKNLTPNFIQDINKIIILNDDPKILIIKLFNKLNEINKINITNNNLNKKYSKIKLNAITGQNQLSNKGILDFITNIFTLTMKNTTNTVNKIN